MEVACRQGPGVSREGAHKKKGGKEKSGWKGCAQKPHQSAKVTVKNIPSVFRLSSKSSLQGKSVRETKRKRGMAGLEERPRAAAVAMRA